MSRALFFGFVVLFLACAVLNVVRWGPASPLVVPVDLGAAGYFGCRLWETR